MYDGAVGDSLELLWNGRDGLGRLREEGSYRLRVTSRSFEGRDEREVEIPLRLVRVASDTLPWPEELPDNAFRPETLVTAEGRHYLTTGLIAAALVAVLPSVVGSDNEGSTLRFGVAALLGAGGLFGLKRASRPIVIVENVTWNRERRAAQVREIERIRAENDARRATNGLRITSGAATVVVLP